MTVVRPSTSSPPLRTSPIRRSDISVCWGSPCRTCRRRTPSVRSVRVRGRIMAIRRLWRDEAGGALVEATVLIPILFVFLLGSVDFLYASYQWTAASKAAQLGARLAAVSDPVATGLTGNSNIATLAVSGTVLLGDAMPDFQVTCASAACTCTRGTCPGLTGYSATAMNTILFGRGSTSCT